MSEAKAERECLRAEGIRSEHHNPAAAHISSFTLMGDALSLLKRLVPLSETPNWSEGLLLGVFEIWYPGTFSGLSGIRSPISDIALDHRELWIGEELGTARERRVSSRSSVPYPAVLRPSCCSIEASENCSRGFLDSSDSCFFWYCSHEYHQCESVARECVNLRDARYKQVDAVFLVLGSCALSNLPGQYILVNPSAWSRPFSLVVLSSPSLPFWAGLS